MMNWFKIHLVLLVVVAFHAPRAGRLYAAQIDTPQIVNVEGQPLAANVRRVLEALEYLGAALPANEVQLLEQAASQRDAKKLQQLLDPRVLFVVSLNPEVRVKVQRGPATARLTQGGFTPVLIKIANQSTVTRQLRIQSPQAGPVYSGAALAILQRQAQTELNEGENAHGATDRFLQVEMFQSPPMTRNLSGLEAEYAIALIYCHESGKREATIRFDVGAGTQDIGFRGEVPILFDARPAIPVRLSIRDHDGQPTIARLVFRDRLGHVYPPQVKRLAPDFFFQPQVYRGDGDVILLPPGHFEVESCRGPEYLITRQNISVSRDTPATVPIELKRWINPQQFGFYCGDHHIHGAGCSHYEQPTQGVTPHDMFRQVKGEGLNVGCVLTWGPCFDFQRRFFSPEADAVSEPLTLLKYDLEISGFGSAALGHVCLLNLKNQTYPGSDGTKTKGWPSWTVPVMRWAKDQGGVTGYPHSAMVVNPRAAAHRLINRFDANQDGQLDRQECEQVTLLPETFDAIDVDDDRQLSLRELEQSHDRAADQLPHLAIPEMNGPGALEICVATAEGVCDFISAMDTRRVSEWNTWYHLMNCGFPIKVSGETDFPCMSSRRVGQGRVYVQLGDMECVDFEQWCRGIAQGKSYVSDGYAHCVQFQVNGQSPGDPPIDLARPGSVEVQARVAFAETVPRAVAYGTITPAGGRRLTGDTVNLHAPRTDATVTGGMRLVEIVANGRVVAQQSVPADSQIHDLSFEIPIDQSSWIALRHFPQLHTNPVEVRVNDRPIRAWRASAIWCAETIRQLWEKRHHFIAESERAAAEAAYQRAIATYERIAAEAEQL